MSDIQLPKLETPPNAVPVNEPVIFSMPEKYRGLTARVNPPLVKPANSSSPAIVAKSIPPPLPKPIPAILKKKKGLDRSTKILLIAGGVILLVLIGGAIYALTSLKTVPVVIEEIPKTNTTPKTNVSPAVTTPVNPVKPTNSQSSTTPVSPFPQGSQPGRDTDSDGLTDAEEILYRTNSKLPDTDSDGFLDGNEVFHGYDPNIPSPAKLSDSTIVSQFDSVDKLFSLLYPTIWVTRLSEDGKSTVFVAPSGETFSVTEQVKEPALLLTAWFSGTNPNVTTKVIEGKTKKGYTMLTTDNQMTVYIDAGSAVLILDYQNTVKATVDFLRTFSMMTNSLNLLVP
ncbi:MAG: thrombospondin type 3 repeat-containing protein [Candidatus Uhrbacteria bacterium]